MSKIHLDIHGGEPTANSLDVARHFDKRHKNVLQAIENIRAEFSALTPEPLFFESTYQSGTGKHHEVKYLLCKTA